MSHYKSNLRDIEFNLFEVLGRDEVLGTGPFAEVDVETARSILSEVDRLAREDLAASYEDADRNPPVFDPATSTAPIPESFKRSYRAWMDAEYWRLQIPEALGGTPAPSSLNWAVAELVLGSNAPVWMYGCGPAFAAIVHKRRQRARPADRRDHRRARSGARRWCSPSRTPVRTSAPAAARRHPTRTARGTSRASSASSPQVSTT